MAYTTRETTVLPSAVRAATTASPDMDNEGGHHGVIVFIDFTVQAGAETITATIQGKSTLSAEYYTILASAALGAVGNTILRVFPGSTVTANLAANDVLPALWRVNVVHSAAGNHTYSINAILLP